jgi:signal transduction histidine kinase
VQRAPERRDLSRAEALSRLSDVLADTTLDYEGVVEAVVRLAAQFLNSGTALQLFDETHMFVEAVVSRARRGDRLAPVVKALRDQRSSVLMGADERSRHGRIPALSADGRIAEASRIIFPDHPGLLLEQGVSSLIWLPLRAGGGVLGTLALLRFGESPPHSQRDLALARDLSDRTALAIHNARLIRNLREELSERLQAEQSTRLSLELVQRADAQRRALLGDLVTAQEEERQFIAADVHDDSLQAMAGVGLGLDRLYRRLSGTEFAQLVSELREDVDGAVARLRDLLFRLSPATLEHGLPRAFEVFLTRYFPADSVEISVDSGVRHEPPDDTRVVLYRVAQEALINILKHAAPSRVSVSIEEVSHGYSVVVRDDGIGFDVQRAIDHSLPGHMGLRAMRRRAESAGGWLRIDSAPGAGTTVQIWLPVHLGDLAGEPHR